MLQIKFASLERPRHLSLAAFSWDDNNLSRHFQSCGQVDGFLQAWEKHIKPYLNESSGKFTPPSAALSTSGATPNDKQLNIESPPSLLPATKVARLQQDKFGDHIPDSADGKDMDVQIAQHFIGKKHKLQHITTLLLLTMCGCTTNNMLKV